MLVNESGPFNLVLKLRELTGIIHDDEGFAIENEKGSPLTCIYCTSVWVALALLILPQWVTKVMAISGLAVIVEKRR